MNNTILAQTYLEENYADKSIKIIDNSAKIGIFDITNELVIQDYPNLEKITLSNNELTSLTIINCPNLKEINVRNNQLTKLEIQGDNKIVEIIAGQNQLENFFCSDCSNLEKLIIQDNPLLTEIKGLNLTKLKSINITNTSINLGKEIESLKEKNKHLYEALNEVNQARLEKKLGLVEPIQTAKQAGEAILRHLKKVEGK